MMRARAKAATVVAVVVLSPSVLALADNGSILPPGRVQFTDANGQPYPGGQVFFYIPGTSTPKTTWQDPAESTANTNPVVLDSAGRATIWGSGAYREVLFDQFGDIVWDQPTSAGISGALGTVGSGPVVLQSGANIISSSLTNATANTPNISCPTCVATVATIEADGGTPSALAGPTAIPGSALTFLRSDGAPAVQLGSASQFGIVESDGTTLTASGGVLSAAHPLLGGVSCTLGTNCLGTATGTTNLVLDHSPTLVTPTLNAPNATSLPDDAGDNYACYNSGNTHMTRHSSACVSSDERLKTNWGYDLPGLELIENLRPGTFDWLDVGEQRANGRQAGLTAQSVELWIPEIVSTGPGRNIKLADGTTRQVSGVKSLDYAKLVLPLVIAVQEQQREIRWLGAGVFLLLAGLVFLLLRSFGRASAVASTPVSRGTTK